MLNKIDIILDNFKNNIPQAIVRINDGEMAGIMRPGSMASRGDQVINKRYSDKLIECLEHEQNNYWIGIPCSLHYPAFHSVAMSYVDSDYKHLTQATIMINRNFDKVNALLPEYFKDKTIYWIGNVDHNVDNLPFNINTKYNIPSNNALSEYDNISYIDHTFDPGSIILLSAGPMGRILAKEWFEKRSDCSFIDVGSFFDPYTRSKSFKYQRVDLPHCLEYN